VVQRLSLRASALLVLLALLGCGPALPPPTKDCARHAAEDPNPCATSEAREGFRYDLLFTNNQHGRPEASCERPMCRALLAALDRADASIDFAIYGVRSQPTIVEALERAAQRGVRVRGVVDTENADCTRFGYEGTRGLIDALGAENVACDSGPGFSDIMHNKFFVLDRARVWTGSTNISDTELGGEYNTDVSALLDSSDLAGIYTQEFEEMFGGSCHRRKRDNTVHYLDFSDGTRVQSYFSPTDRAIDRAVLPVVDDATSTLDVSAFYLTSEPIAEALIRAATRGVRIRVILDASGAANSYSRHAELCGRGVAVKVENWGGKAHGKWLLADAATNSAAVVFGSMNFTKAGDANNDENTLVVRHQQFAAEFAAEFEREWHDLAQVPACGGSSVEGAESSRCEDSGDCARGCSSGSCCDGLDNDYDGRTDASEEACGCTDGVDNDADGYTDAEDFDCQRLEDP